MTRNATEVNPPHGDGPPARDMSAAREIAPAWAGLVLLAGLAWLIVVRQSGQMDAGTGTMGISPPLFLAMWLAMMAAMMFPSVAPVALMWTRSIRGRSHGARRAIRTVGFLSGYLVAWLAYGTLAFAGLLGVDRLIDASPTAARWLGVGIFAAAGIYQLTPLKEACLRHCRSPMTAILHYASFKGAARDLRVGLHHGLYCVGCCWGLMVVLVAVGVMNVAAMAALAVVIFLEKLWQRGPGLSRAIGVAFLLIATLIPFHPWLIPGLRIAEMPSGGM
jgi:predicted metal-binding membrane protein